MAGEGELRSDGGLARTRPHNTLHLGSGSLACSLQSDTNKLYFDAVLLEFGAFMGMGIGEGMFGTFLLHQSTAYNL